MKETYNGWTNYATWRVNLEMFDGTTIEDLAGNRLLTMQDLAELIKVSAQDVIDHTAPEGLARDYAYAFISDVNWYEIARHMLEEVATEGEE